MFRQWSFHGELKFLNWKLQNLNLSAAVVTFLLLEMPADNELSAILNRRCSSKCHQYHHHRLLQTKFRIRNCILFLTFEFQKPDQWHSWQWGRGEAEICQGLIFPLLTVDSLSRDFLLLISIQYSIFFRCQSTQSLQSSRERRSRILRQSLHCEYIDVVDDYEVTSILCGTSQCIVWSCFHMNWLEMSWMNWIGEKEGAGW